MKRLLSLIVAIGLIAVPLLASGVARADGTIAVPATPLIKDPVGDANYLNDQGFGGDCVQAPACVPSSGDNTTPADVGTVTDIEAVWFTNDVSNFSVNIQTEGKGPATQGYFYRVEVDPGSGSDCFWFQYADAGASNAGAATASIRDSCNSGATTPTGTAAWSDGPNGTGILTITYPRDDKLGALAATGAVMKTPFAQVVNFTGTSPSPSVTAPSIDNTKTGTDYTMTAGDSSVTTPAPKHKKHKKHKKKKKGKGTAPAPAGCAPFQPGDKGKDAKTAVVTDAATKDAPVSVSMPIDPGLGSGTGTPADAATLAAESNVFQNVQVDTSQPSAGLYVRAEFDSNSDDDLFLYNPDGTEAAHAAGFNPEPAISDGTGTGGHSENGAEQIDGINTADCQGYTAELDGATTTGGTVTFKFWLGDVTWDPNAAPGGLVWAV